MVSGTVELTETSSRNIASVRAFLRLLGEKDMQSWKELWAPDADLFWPFGGRMFPARVTGREEIFERWRGLPDTFASMAFPIQEIWTDGDTVFARFVGDCVLADGRTYRNDYLSIWRYRPDGKIQAYSEYFDPIVAGEAFGMLSVSYLGTAQ